MRDELAGGDRVADLRRRSRLRQLRRRGDRPAGVRPAGRRAGPAASSTRRRRCSRAARPTTARATSCARRSSSARTRPTRCSRASTSGRSSACYVYDDTDLGSTPCMQLESVSPYALTGAVFARDRAAIDRGFAGCCASPPATSTSTTSRPVRSSGSSRSVARARPEPTTRPARSGTCCAGCRRASIKETFVPPTDHRYPHMD